MSSTVSRSSSRVFTSGVIMALRMSDLLGRLTLKPLYGQIFVEGEDPGTSPIPETGDEPVVATPESILVATRSDTEGDVNIEIRRGAPGDAQDPLVFAGSITVATPVLVVGSIVGNRVLRIPLARAGKISLQINVDVPGRASRVVVALR